jgi:hypothetical protein
MKKMLQTVAVVALCASTVTSVHAEKKLNPWQECGIGAMIFPDHGIASAISNIIWDLGTTAVTSASASEDSCAGSRAVAAQFINETYNALEEEIVTGNGKHFTAMASLMACDANQSASIRNQLAENMASETFATQSKVVKAESLFNIADASCAKS